MLYFDRIDISEGIDINKTSASKECDICYYWYFLEGFKFQAHFCNRCHDVLMMTVNLSDIAILNINCVDHRCVINRISKREAVNLLQKADLQGKPVEHYRTIFLYHV